MDRAAHSHREFPRAPPHLSRVSVARFYILRRLERVFSCPRAQSTHAITKMHASAEWIKIRERKEEKIDPDANGNGKTLPIWFWLLSLYPVRRAKGKISPFHKEYVRVKAGRFGTRRNLIERAQTASRMRKVGSSRPWLFHIFQLCARIFPLPVGEFFSNFWWQLRSNRCVCIPIFKKFCRWEKKLKQQ